MTEAEFIRFLRHGSSQVAVIVDIEFAYESGGVQATGTLRFSDVEDAVLGVKYQAGMERAPELERAIDLRLGGRGARTLGSITLNNNDGRFDYVLDVIIDGRDVVIRVGGQGWALSDYRMLGTGAAASVKASGDAEIVIELRDKNFLLDATVIGSPIPSGPNAGKPKPIVIGTVRNLDVGPYMTDIATLTYAINDFAMATGRFRTADVRDNGVSLRTNTLLDAANGTITTNNATETLTYAPGNLLSANDVIYFSDGSGSSVAPPGFSFATQYWVLAAGLTATDFRLSLTQGGSPIDITINGANSGRVIVSRQRFYIDDAAATLRLSGSPAGRVTIDYTGIDAAGLLGSTGVSPHSAFLYLLQTYSSLGVGEYDSSAISALGTIEASTDAISYGRAILDRVNLLQLLDEIAQATWSWYAWDSANVLTVGRLALASLDGESAIDTIDGGDLHGEVASENLPLPFGKVVLDAGRNIVIQTDGIAAAVTAANRSLWGQQFQARVSTTDPGTTGYLANWWDYHKSAIDSKPIETVLDATSGVDVGLQAACDAITELYKPWTRVHRCTVGLDKYALNPGDCVNVTYPRYGLSAGKNCRVISVKPRASERICDLVLVRQAQPDYTTAAH